MNKVYKVIFNKSLGVFVAVSEKAKSALKSSSTGSTPKAISLTPSYNTKSFKLGLLACMLLSANAAHADLQIDGSASYPNNITNSTDYIVVGEANHNKDSKATNIFGKNNTSIKGQNVVLNGTGNYVASFQEAPASYISLVGNNQTANNSSHISSLGASNSFYGDYIGVLGEVNKIGGNWATGTTKAENVYGLGFNNQIGTNTASKNISFIATNSTLDGNSIYAIGSDLTATGNNNVLIGGKNKTIGNSNTAVGQNATIQGSNSTAIGANSTSNANKATAVGYIARANGEASVAIGSEATVSSANANSVALGANSNANGMSLQQDAYLTKSKATAEINMANGNSQRRITGIADGALDTDAVTVRQVKVIDTKIDTTKTDLTNAGLNFGANSGNAVHRNLGDKFNIVGGGDAAKATSGENVVTRTTADGVSIELAKDVKFDTVTTGNTTISNTGVIIKDGPSITTTGINAGGKRVTGVANGETATDAVNKSQLDQVVAQQGNTVKYDGADQGTITLQGKGGTTIANVKDGVADKDAVNVGQLKAVDTKIDTTKTDLTNQIGSTKTELNTNINNSKTELNAKIDTTKTDLTNAGLNFGANSGDTVHRNLGDKFNIVGGGDAAKATSGENVVTRTTADGVSIELAKDVKFDTVTTGNTTISNSGLTIKDGPSVTDAGINAGGKRVTGVANGTTNTDAVNFGQLKAVDTKIDTTKTDLTNQIGTTKTELTTLVDNTKTEFNSKIDSTKTDLTNQIGTTKTELNTKIDTTKTDLTNAGMNFGANSGDTVHRNLGDKFNIVGGGDASQATSGENVVTRTTADGVTVELAKDVKFDTVTTGNTTINNSGLTIKDGPSVTDAGINAGGKRVTGVANGTANTDAVNFGQLKVVDTKIDNTKTELNNKITDTNTKIDTTKTELTGQIDTAKSELNTRIDTTKTDLTNQIDITKTDLANQIGTTKTELNTKIDTTKTDLTNAGLNFTGNSGDTVHRNLGGTFNIGGDGDASKATSGENVVTRTTEDGIKVELLKDVNFDSITTGNTTINNSGLTIKDGPSITTTGINAGGKRVTGVADGETANDAVNKGQLDKVIDQQGNLDNAAVKYDGADKGKITLQGKDGTTITNVKDGVAATDAVNVRQLGKVDSKVDTVRDDLTGQIGTTKTELNTRIDNTKTELNTNITNTKTDLTNAGLNFGANSGDTVHRNLGDKFNIVGGGDAAKATSGENVVTRTTADGITIELAKDVKFDSVATGNTTINNSGLIIKDGPSVTIDGINAGSKRVTGVADGETANDAVNKGQLDKVIDQQGNLDNAAVKYDGADKGSITLQGKDGTTITNVKDGIAETDAVNVRQLGKVDSKVDGVRDDLTGQINTTKTEFNTQIDNTKTEFNTRIDTTKTDLTNQIDNTETVLTGQINTTKTELNTKIDNTKTDLTNAGLNFGANSGDTVHRNLGDKFNIVGGGDASQATSGENVVTRTTEDGIKVELLKDVNFDSVTTGNTTINNSGLIIKDGPSVTTAGINAGDKRVTGVANGESATDAVNKGQLDDVVAQQGNLDNSAVKYDAANKGKITLQGKDGTTIANVKDGVAATDAVNVRQLGKVDEKVESTKTELTTTIDNTKTELSTKIDNTKTDLTNAGMNFGANSGDTVHRNLGDKFNIVGGGDASKATSGENVVTRTTEDGISIELAKDVKFDTVTTGNTTLSNNGLIIKDGPSVTTAGINAGGKRVTGVAKGEIAKDSTDAVNGDQVHNISTSVKNSIGGETKINADGTITTQNIGGTGQNTIDKAIGSVNSRVDEGITNVQNTGMNFGANTGSTVHRKLGQTLNITGGSDADEDATSGENVVTRTTADGIKVELVKDVKFDSVTVGGNIFNNQGLFIQNGPSITAGGINAGGKRVTNIANGVDSTDAVNKGQLDQLKNEVTQEIGKIPTNVVKYDQDKKDTVTLEGENGTTLTNVKDGKVAENSKDAVNGGQLWNVQKQVDQNTTDISNIQNNIENINNGKSGLVQQTAKDANITVGKDTGGKAVDMSGKDGDRVVQGVAKGEISATSNQAVNGSQIYQINDSIKTVIGGETKLNEDGTLSANNIGGTGKNTIDGAIGAVNQSQQQLGNRVDYLEQAFYDTNKRLDSVKKDLSAGIASAMAVGNLPQPTSAGKSMVSAGLSGFGGQGAVAIGMSAITDNNKYVWKFGGTADTRSNVSGTISVGYQW